MLYCLYVCTISCVQYYICIHGCMYIYIYIYIHLIFILYYNILYYEIYKYLLNKSWAEYMAYTCNIAQMNQVADVGDGEPQLGGGASTEAYRLPGCVYTCTHELVHDLACIVSCICHDVRSLQELRPTRSCPGPLVLIRRCLHLLRLPIQ